MSKDYKPPYVKKILVSSRKVKKGIKKAAKWLDDKFMSKKTTPIFVSVLKGSLPFYGELVKHIHFDVLFDYIAISSYKGKITCTSKPKIIFDLTNDVKGKDVVVIEDVVDRGNTLSLLVSLLKKRKAKSVIVMVLVDKSDMRTVPFKPDYVCFELLHDPFLIGWGLDYNEKARNLPYIAEFDKSYIDRI